VFSVPLHDLEDLPPAFGVADVVADEETAAHG
jgi:hypothetical protein